MSLSRYFRTVTRPAVRRRLAPLILVGGGVLAFDAGRDAVPESQHVVVRLPDGKRSQIRRVQLSYARDGADVGGLAQSYPAGAPSEVHHTISLARGQYELSIAVTDTQGAVGLTERALDVPTEGSARFQLEAQGLP
jgi:hypothetical protein